MSERPPVFQPYVPFLEMSIKGHDILRGRDGRPRTLMSFSHDIFPGHNGGMWTVQIFDPSYVGTEELLLDTAGAEGNDSAQVETEVGTEVTYGDGVEAGGDVQYWAVSGVVFRYGYVGDKPGQFVTSLGPKGEKYWFGSVHAYTASYQAEGTYITLRGDTLAGGIGKPKDPTYADTYEVDPYDVIKQVCEDEGWTLNSPGSRLNAAPLKPEEEPVGKRTVEDGIDHTQETYPTYKRKENQDAYEFVNELCNKLRTKDPAYANYTVQWETRVESAVGNTGKVVGNPTIYCHFGPFGAKQDPVRTYVYLRDAKTDIISFNPEVDVSMLDRGGSLGVTFKDHDARTAVQGTNAIDEIQRQQKYFTADRKTSPYIDSASAIALQKGTDVQQSDAPTEGAQTGQQTIAPPQAPDPDEPWQEKSVLKRNRSDADIQMMNHFLGMWMWANTATLEIIGDPSPELAPTKMVAVLVYVPVGTGVRLHWVSGLWWITGVSHTIQGGSFTTSMELGRCGMEGGGVTTKGFSRAVANTLATEGAMETSGG